MSAVRLALLADRRKLTNATNPGKESSSSSKIEFNYVDTAVRLKVEENQLVDVFSEIGFHIDGLKGR
jgi:hypothetical protein